MLDAAAVRESVETIETAVRTAEMVMTVLPHMDMDPATVRDFGQWTGCIFRGALPLLSAFTAASERTLSSEEVIDAVSDALSELGDAAALIRRYAPQHSDLPFMKLATV